MNKKNVKIHILLIFSSICIFCFMGCASNSNDIEVKDIVQNEYISEENGIIYRNNSIVILFEENTSQEEIDEVVKSIDGTISSGFEDLWIYNVKIDKKDSLKDIENLCNELKQNEFVEYAFPEYYNEIGLDSSDSPNDN